MQCVFHSQSDDPETCLLGSKITVCGTIKCLKTLGQHCSSKSTEHKISGNECGASLICDCDGKCSGCMNINGEEKCRYSANCLPSVLKDKRNKINSPDPFDYPVGHDRMVAIYS